MNLPVISMNQILSIVIQLCAKTMSTPIFHNDNWYFVDPGDVGWGRTNILSLETEIVSGSL